MCDYLTHTHTGSLHTETQRADPSTYTQWTKPCSHVGQPIYVICPHTNPVSRERLTGGKIKGLPCLIWASLGVYLRMCGCVCGSEPVVTETKRAFFSPEESDSCILYMMSHTHKLTHNLMRLKESNSSGAKAQHNFCNFFPLTMDRKSLQVLNHSILSSVESPFSPMKPALIIALLMPN